MDRMMQLRNDIASLELSLEQVEALEVEIDCWAIHDMIFRLNREIRDARREMLVLDAEALVRTAGSSGIAA